MYAYATASAYIAAGMAKHALVIGAELLTRFLDYTDRGTCILFGDGAGAVVLSGSDEPATPVGIEMTTEPQGAYMIWLPAGGSKSPPSAETVARGEHRIRMEGKETYRFATRTLASTALAAVGKAGWTQDDVDLIVPHQANIRIIEAVAKGLDISMDKIYVNLDRYGNTSAASVPIALAEAVNEGRLAGRRQAGLRRVRGGLHLRCRGHGVDRGPGPGPDRRRGRPPRGRRPSGCPWTGTPWTRSRPRWRRSSPGRCPATWTCPTSCPASPSTPTTPTTPHERHSPLNPPGPRRDTPRGGRTRCST